MVRLSRRLDGASVATVRAAALALFALTAAACGGGLGAPLRGPDLGALQPPPAQLPEAQGGAADALLGGTRFSSDNPTLDWGDGALRPRGARFEAVDLALFDAPGGRHWGWLTQGRVYDLANARTLPDRRSAAVTVAGEPALLVISARPDGWLQVRYGQPDDRAGGLAWTRESLATGGRMRYAAWADLLNGARGLVYRNADAPHNLRAGPSTNAEVVETLEGRNFDMTALAIDGDWMQVRVATPPACAGSVAEDLLLGGTQERERTGWIAWRSDAQGPWVRDASGPRCGGGA